MSEEEDIDQTAKSSDTPEDGNENASQEQAIEQSKTQSEYMEVHHHPHCGVFYFMSIQEHL